MYVIIKLCSFFSDLVNLKRSDIVFYENHLPLLISMSKTQKLKTGSNVIVSRIDNVTCPYNLLKLYSKIAIFSGQLLFVRNLVNINYEIQDQCRIVGVENYCLKH